MIAFQKATVSRNWRKIVFVVFKRAYCDTLIIVPHVTAAIAEQAAKGTVCAAPAEVQLVLTPVPVEPRRRAAVG